MINTNILDVNLQNQFSQSTEQYFQGKMFNQNINEYQNQQITSNNSNDSQENKMENLNNFKDVNENKGKEDNFKIPTSSNHDNKEKPKRKSRFDQ